MKLFRFRGGVHPASNKRSTAEQSIQPLPMPKRLYIPLQQHIGAPAAPEVEVGQHVLKGQLLAHSQGMISAPVHAPTSGTVIAIDDFTAPHPSGLPVRTITLEADGEDKWISCNVTSSPFTLTPAEIAARVGAAGIVGLGGATFPAAVKLNSGLKEQINTLIINGGECEPYLTCDDRLMQERPKEVIDGVLLITHALQAQQALIAIEDNKPDALKALQEASSHYSHVKVIKVPSLYPMGSEKQLIRTLTGLEVPAGGRATDIGIVVHNVATAYAVHNAIRSGQPLISRIVTVSGGAIKNPTNVEVPLGTLVSDLLDYCGLKDDPARLLVGGPMMGQVLPHTHVPVIKGCNGIIALTKEDISKQQVKPCIRCGQCVSVCPVGLLPLEMAARINKGDIDSAVKYGLPDCISCGSCSYVCPAHIPLVHYFNYAKGELVTQKVQQTQADKFRELTKARSERLDRIKKAKQQAAEERKKARQAKAAASKASAS
jgi:electron transport complex protein RnfC